MRYRGAKWDGLLGGKLLFGDHVRGRIWTATLDAGGGAPGVEEIVSGLPTGNKAGLGNFCTDSGRDLPDEPSTARTSRAGRSAS
jgi:hypothetical protein